MRKERAILPEQVFIRTDGAETVTTKGFDVLKTALRKPFSG